MSEMINAVRVATRSLVVLPFVGAAATFAAAAEPTRIHLANDDHTDVM